MDIILSLGAGGMYVAESQPAPALVAAVRKALIAAGVDEDDIRSEEFFGY